MKYYLDDIGRIVSDSPARFDGKRNYISTGAVDDDRIDSQQVEVVQYSSRPSRANLVAKENDVLFAKMQNTRKTLLIDPHSENDIYSTGFCCFRPNAGISSLCVYYLLSSEQFLTQKNKYSSGATQKAITNEGLRKIQFGFPYENQEYAAATLAKVSEGIAVCKQLLVDLDVMVKSQFVEMFGTLEKPAQNFQYDILKNLCNKITDGKHGGCTTEAGTNRYFVGAREIYDDQVHYDTAPQISIAEFEKDYRRCNVEKGDFLIVNTGATIGKSAIAVDERTRFTLLQKSVALLKLKKEYLNPVFLKWCYRINTDMYLVQNASAQPNLLLSKINATRVYVPSIEQQNAFAEFSIQADKSKSVVQQQLAELETLKKSLMQEYFG